MWPVVCASGLPETTAGVGVASARYEGRSEIRTLVVSQLLESRLSGLGRQNN